jgi:bacterioferritin
VNIGESVAEQLRLDLGLELEAVERLNKGVAVCNDAGDNNSRHLLEEILHEEEEHIDWIEAQLSLIEQVGIQNYLAEQIKKDE